MAGRSAERGNAIVKELTAAAAAAAPAAAAPPVFTFEPIDAFSLKACDAFATRYKESARPLDLLVLTQGMATVQGFTPTAEGLDQKLTLHYYSRVVLARALAPLLAESSDARVLSVLSAGVHGAYTNYASDPELKSGCSASPPPHSGSPPHHSGSPPHSPRRACGRCSASVSSPAACCATRCSSDPASAARDVGRLVASTVVYPRIANSIE